MSCEKIKDLILSDYSDGRISEKLEKQITEHLNSCENCREFAQAVKKTAIEPFRKAEKIKAPDYLLSRIKDKITSQEQRPALGGLLDNLRIVFQPRPAFTLATVAAVVILVLVITTSDLYNGNGVNEYLSEHMDSLYPSDEEAGYLEIDFGTDIEKYFL